MIAQGIALGVISTKSRASKHRRFTEIISAAAPHPTRLNPSPLSLTPDTRPLSTSALTIFHFHQFKKTPPPYPSCTAP